MPAVTSPVKVTDAGDESNLEQVCEAVISFREKLCPKAFLTPILISNWVHNRTISIRRLFLMVQYKT